MSRLVRTFSVGSNTAPSAMVLNNLGAALTSLDKHEEGCAMLEQALALDPTDPDVAVNLGIQSQEEGDLDRAKSLYTRCGALGRAKQACAYGAVGL